MIRKAIDKDIPKCCELAFGEFMEEQTWLTGTDFSLMSLSEVFSSVVSGNVPGELWVAEVEGRTVGFLYAQYVHFATDLMRPVCHEVGWYVEPQARGQGLGFALLAAVETAAKEKGAAAVSLGVAITDAGHEGLMKKYATLGYKPFQTQAFKVLGGKEQ